MIGAPAPHAAQAPGQELEDRLRASGALLHGHFRLSSGLHAERYVQCALLLAEPAHARWAGRALAAAPPRAAEADRVLSPALGGVIIGHEVAAALGCPFAFAEWLPDGPFELRRGLAIQPGERVLVVEDVVTTGGSVAELVRLVEDAGATCSGIACLVRRDPTVTSIAGAPVTALLDVEARAVPPDACPQCARGSTAVAPGSRHA